MTSYRSKLYLSQKHKRLFFLSFVYSDSPSLHFIKTISKTEDGRARSKTIRASSLHTHIGLTIHRPQHRHTTTNPIPLTHPAQSIPSRPSPIRNGQPAPPLTHPLPPSPPPGRPTPISHPQPPTTQPRCADTSSPTHPVSSTYGKRSWTRSSWRGRRWTWCDGVGRSGGQLRCVLT